MMLMGKGIALALLILGLSITPACWGEQTPTPTTQATPEANTTVEVWVTGYSEEEGFGQWTRTSNGTIPGWGTCGVDPNIFPYGTVFYSRNYEVMCGRYLIALDSGGAVKGSHLDYWTETDAQSRALTGYETVTILRLGWYNWLVDPEKWGLPK